MTGGDALVVYVALVAVLSAVYWWDRVAAAARRALARYVVWRVRRYVSSLTEAVDATAQAIAKAEVEAARLNRRLDDAFDGSEEGDDDR